MRNKKAIFKSMLVTKDGNYHKSYHLTINLKKKEEDDPSSSIDVLFFLPSKTTFLMGSLLKEELLGEFSGFFNGLHPTLNKY